MLDNLLVGLRSITLISLYVVVCQCDGSSLVRPSRDLRNAIKECDGFEIDVGSQESHLLIWNRLRHVYSNCTHVRGNLSITHLQSPTIAYDLSFLRDIRYVTGYVLIFGVTRVASIPLSGLQIIRGNYSYPHRRHLHGPYTLLVSSNQRQLRNGTYSGLTYLEMPRLVEISEGHVLFADNLCLRYVNTIDWGMLARGRSAPVEFVHPDAYDVNPPPLNSGALTCPGGRVWANNRLMCQKQYIRNQRCHPFCKKRCHSRGLQRCCHPSCAGGCSAPGDNHCQLCKDFILNTRCVSQCPTRKLGQLCYYDRPDA